MELLNYDRVYQLNIELNQIVNIIKLNLENGWNVALLISLKLLPKTGTPLDAVPVQ